MTRNLYLGADINRAVIAASRAHAQGGAPDEILVALAHAMQVTRAIVDQTNFRVRASLLAGEIAEVRPDLVGMQEVALWRSGPLDLDRAGIPDASDVDDDFLQVLLDALAACGLDYAPVQVATRADVESPSFSGSPIDGTGVADARDVRLTLRDVILMRVDPGLRIADTGDALYAANLAASVPGLTVRFDRGYQWVDVVAGETRLRFVNTHLEAFSSDLALAQAGELLEVAAGDRTTVLVGDFNSDPLRDEVGPFDQAPHNAPYELITGSGGFTDEWLRWAPAEEGWTSGLSELVDDPTAAGFDHRIDMVFGRTADGDGLEVDRGEVTGTDPADRDPDTGLWPSDHGGVVLRLRI